MLDSPLRTAEQGTWLDADHQFGAVLEDGRANDAECTTRHRYAGMEVLIGIGRR